MMHAIANPETTSIARVQVALDAMGLLSSHARRDENGWLGPCTRRALIDFRSLLHEAGLPCLERCFLERSARRWADSVDIVATAICRAAGADATTTMAIMMTRDSEPFRRCVAHLQARACVLQTGLVDEVVVRAALETATDAEKNQLL